MASQAVVDPEELYIINAKKATSIIMTHDAKTLEVNSLIHASDGQPPLRSILTNFVGHNPADEVYDLFYLDIDDSLFLCEMLKLDECADLIKKNELNLQCFVCQRAPGSIDRNHHPNMHMELHLTPAVPVRCLRHLGLVSLKDILTFQGVKPWDLQIKMHEMCRTMETFTVLMPGEPRVQPFIGVDSAINLIPEQGSEAYDLRQRLGGYKNEVVGQTGFEHLSTRAIIRQNGMIIVMVHSRYLLMRRSDLKLYGPAIRPFVRNERVRLDDMAPSDTAEPWIAIGDVENFGPYHTQISRQLEQAVMILRQLPPVILYS